MCAAIIFFFFQAEDGIRDVAVTGVQTCALPISWRRCDQAVSRLSFATTRRAERRSSAFVSACRYCAKRVRRRREWRGVVGRAKHRKPVTATTRLSSFSFEKKKKDNIELFSRQDD